MNKAILFVFAVIFAAALVFAQGPSGVHEPGTGLENPELKEATQGTGAGLNASEDANQEMNLGEDEQIREEAGKEKGQTLRIRDSEVHSELEVVQEMVQNQTQYRAKLSNGLNSELKVMPNTASARALEVLGAKCGERNCSIELKEVGTGNQTRAAYEVQAQKEVRVLGLFKAQMRVQAQIDAENGEVLKQKKAWWAFLAAEPSVEPVNETVSEENASEDVTEEVSEENATA